MCITFFTHIIFIWRSFSLIQVSHTNLIQQSHTTVLYNSLILIFLKNSRTSRLGNTRRVLRGQCARRRIEEQVFFAGERLLDTLAMAISVPRERQGCRVCVCDVDGHLLASSCPPDSVLAIQANGYAWQSSNFGRSNVRPLLRRPASLRRRSFLMHPVHTDSGERHWFHLWTSAVNSRRDAFLLEMLFAGNHSSHW